MDRKMNELQQKMKDLHEKSRQEAMLRFKGKELEEALKKIDGMYRPLERLSAGSQERLKLTRKYLLILMLQLPLVILFFIAAEKSLNPVLYFHETMNLAAFFILFPVLASGAYSLITRRIRRQMSIQGVAPPVMRYRPLVRNLLLFSASLILGIAGLYVTYAIAALSMSYLNEKPVQIASTVIEISDIRGSAQLRVPMPAEEQGAWISRNEALVKLPPDHVESPLRQGDRIVITGREGFAGIVVDRIQKAR